MTDRDIEILAPQADRPPIVVLLIDDQPFVGTAIARLLSGEPDIPLHCCTDGAEALAHAHSIRPSVILQDLVMPDIAVTNGVMLADFSTAEQELLKSMLRRIRKNLADAEGR